MRSLNNLQERFHQSFFFYLLPATNRYISIGIFTVLPFIIFPIIMGILKNNLLGVYMPPFGLMIGSMLLQAVALYVSRKETQNEKDWNFLELGPLLFFSSICGLILKSAPVYLTSLNRSLELGFSTEDVVFGGLCILSVIHCTLFSPFSLRLV